MTQPSGPRQQLLTLLARQSFKLGDFQLSSGGRSDYYIDCRTTTLHAEGGRLTGLAILDLLRHHHLDPHAVGGLTLGADPVVSAVAIAGPFEAMEGISCWLRRSRITGISIFIINARNGTS